MRREDLGKPIEHEVQLQNDDRIKLIIKRKPFSGFDPHRLNKPSKLIDAPLSVSVETTHGQQTQAFAGQNDLTKNDDHFNLCQQDARLSRPKRRFRSVDKGTQPRKKFCNGLSYKVKPDAGVVNASPCRKYSACKQSPKEHFLGNAADRPRILLSDAGYRKTESGCVDDVPVRSLTGGGHDLSYGCANVNNASKCTFAADRLETADREEITHRSNDITKVKSTPVGRLKKVWGVDNSNLPTKVDIARNRLTPKAMLAALPHPQPVQSTALTLHQQTSTKSTMLLPQWHATLSTDATLCQQQSTACSQLESGTSKVVPIRGQRQTILATDTTLCQRQAMLATNTLCQRKTTLATDATICQRKSIDESLCQPLATDTTSCQRQTATSDRGVQIKPHLLGPCEPGTHIRLDSTILALDKNGHLVISASWRGKTLSGFLMEVKPESGWGSQPERVPEPQATGGRLDRKCKRNVTYTVRHRRRRARKVAAAAQEQGAPLTEELDQETERDNEQWEHLINGEYLICPMPECFKKFVNKTALGYHLTSCHRQRKEDDSKPCRTVFKNDGVTESDGGQLAIDGAAHVSYFKKRVMDEENGKRIIREERISECIVPVLDSREDTVKVTESICVPKFSMSADASQGFCAPLNTVPYVSTVPEFSMPVVAKPRVSMSGNDSGRFCEPVDTLSPFFRLTKIRPKCGISDGSEFSTSGDDALPTFFPGDNQWQFPSSDPPSSFDDTSTAHSSSPALHPTSDIQASRSASDPPSLVTPMLEQHSVASGDVSVRTSSLTGAKSSGHELQPLTLVPDDADSKSVVNAFASSLVGDLATLSFGDEYKSLGVSGSILGPEINDLFTFDELDNRLSAIDSCAISVHASREGSMSTTSERLLISVETASIAPAADCIDTSAVSVKLSSACRDNKLSFTCDGKTTSVENSQFPLDGTEVLTVPVDVAENSHFLSLDESLNTFTGTVGSSGNAEFSVYESATIALDEKQFTVNRQLLPPTTNLPVTASTVCLADNSLVVSINEHLQTSSFGVNLMDEMDFTENLAFPSGHEYRTCDFEAFDLPENSQAFSTRENSHASTNGNVQDCSIIENLQKNLHSLVTMETLPSASLGENLQVASSGANLQSSSLSETLDAFCSGGKFSSMFDQYLLASAGITTTEDEACTLSEKASVGGVLNTNSPICFGAEVPSTLNKDRLINIQRFKTENEPGVALSGCDYKEVEKSGNATAETGDIAGLHGGYSTLCFEPVSPASPGVKSPTYQDFSTDLHSTHGTGSREFGSAAEVVDELPVGESVVEQVTVPVTSPSSESGLRTCGSDPPSNDVHSSKIVYDLSDISDPEDEPPASTNLDTNCLPGPWFQLGNNLSLFPSVLPSHKNYSCANFRGTPYDYSSNSSSATGPCLSSVCEGNLSDAPHQISGTSELCQGSCSTKQALGDFSGCLQVSHDCGCNGASTFSQNVASEHRSLNQVASSLSCVDVGNTIASGATIPLDGEKNFEEISHVQQPEEAWSDMFCTYERFSQRSLNQPWVELLDSKDNYSGLQGHNSASTVCDKYDVHTERRDRSSGSLNHLESTNSVNSVLYTPNVSSMDNFLDTLDDHQEISVENYGCNTQRETPSGHLTFEVQQRQNDDK